MELKNTSWCFSADKTRPDVVRGRLEIQGMLLGVSREMLRSFGVEENMTEQCGDLNFGTTFEGRSRSMTCEDKCGATMEV